MPTLNVPYTKSTTSLLKVYLGDFLPGATLRVIRSGKGNRGSHVHLVRITYKDRSVDVGNIYMLIGHTTFFTASIRGDHPVELHRDITVADVLTRLIQEFQPSKSVRAVA